MSNFVVASPITPFIEDNKVLSIFLYSVIGVIGEATTKFDNQPNRNNNIKVAAGKVNEFDKLLVWAGF